MTTDQELIIKQANRITELEALVASIENGWKCRNEGMVSLIEELKEDNAALKNALIWCSGSADFGPGGQAEEGWNKVCRPLLGNA